MRREGRKPTARTVTSETAIALSYVDESGDAPVVSAVGSRELAHEMTKLARRYGVPVVCDDELAGRLEAVPENEPIPEELYVSIAELFHSLQPKKGGS